jgi:hypothetical protein
MIDKLNEVLCVEKHLKYCMSRFITHELVNGIPIPISHVCMITTEHKMHQCKYCPNIFWEDKEQKEYEKDDEEDKEILRFHRVQ